MQHDDFQYRPLNAQKREKPKRLTGLPGFPKFPKFKKGEKHDWKKILIWCGLTLLGLLVLATIAISLAIAVLSIGLPDVKDLDKLAIA
ncbi:hypothetical protein KJ951_01435, partial [Patescibacteria group bacterium]|nr:hypothetical protein [Patescibacteria group bacterium]MBU1703043.1 hypothetical protein [Patescibacteria group bacterium]MBU1954186.1 hypothetical protein [Patescibacteria group bacterium]